MASQNIIKGVVMYGLSSDNIQMSISMLQYSVSFTVILGILFVSMCVCYFCYGVPLYMLISRCLKGIYRCDFLSLGFFP